MKDKNTLNLENAQERLKNLKQKINEALKKSNRENDKVLLLAVSKTFPQELINIYAQAGQLSFAESYAQEALIKIPEVENKNLDWHFIGHLQSNKAKDIVPLFNTVHSLSRLSLAKALNQRAEMLNKNINVLIQVNVSGELSKSGLKPEELAQFYEKVKTYKNLTVKGLMTMPPYDEDSEKARPYFQKLYNLKEKITPNLKELSMGMSGDFEVAIEEGATIIRVGTFLFGNR